MAFNTGYGQKSSTENEKYNVQFISCDLTYKIPVHKGYMCRHICCSIVHNEKIERRQRETKNDLIRKSLNKILEHVSIGSYAALKIYEFERYLLTRKQQHNMAFTIKITCIKVYTINYQLYFKI